MRADFTETNVTLNRELLVIVDALRKITTTCDAIVSCRPPKWEAPALEYIADAVDTIAESVVVVAAVTTIVPDTFPAEWCEGGDAA